MNDNSKQDHPGKNKFGCTFFAELHGRVRGHYHESSDHFEYPKKTLLKSSHPKKYLPNFPTQKNPGIENFNPKNPSIIPVTRNPEYHPPPGISTYLSLPKQCKLISLHHATIVLRWRFTNGNSISSSQCNPNISDDLDLPIFHKTNRLMPLFLENN